MNTSHDEPNSTAVFAQGASVLEGLLTREQLAGQLNPTFATRPRFWQFCDHVVPIEPGLLRPALARTG
jgi:hypothetical protein